jgi:retron-type reverse transcriptase
MDRIVQKAICMILKSIYEPYFEKMNRSFGFRPNKGVHNAITSFTTHYTNGMRIAIESDVEAAFESVIKEK